MAIKEPINVQGLYCFLYSADFRSALNRFATLSGAHLTTINIDISLFAIVCKWTKNIRHLRLLKNSRLWYVVRPGWKEALRYLLPQCQSITLFEMNIFFDQRIENDLGKLFTQMRKLKFLNLTHVGSMISTGHCFNQLAFETIEEITLRDIKQLSDHTVLSTVSYCFTIIKKLFTIYLAEICLN